MRSFDPRFVDHFEHPRHVGDVARPSGRADLSNPVCGDRLRLSLRVEDGRVAEVKFRVQGCAGTIAAGSALCELVTGVRLDEAARVDRDAIEAALGELPPLKRHGADLAADALRAALADAAGAA